MIITVLAAAALAAAAPATLLAPARTEQLVRHNDFSDGPLADAAAQNHHAGLPQQPRLHSVRIDFECTSTFKVRSVRLIMESSEKGTRYANRLKTLLVNEKALGGKDIKIVQKVIDDFNTLPQARLMCSEDRASLYIGPEYRKIGYSHGKFIPAPHVVDILSIRPDGVALDGKMQIAK